MSPGRRVHAFLHRLPAPVAVALGVLAGSVVVAVWFCWPILASGHRFGVHDWDMHLFYAETARRTLMRYHQLPWWNPWYCGGSPLLGNPQSPLLDPWFVLTLLVGTVRGAKLAIVAHQAVALAGAWLLARRCGAARTGATLAALVYGLSSVYPLHLAAGHANWMAYAWLPLAVAGTVGAAARGAAGDHAGCVRESLLGAAATALLLFAGNAYFFVYQYLLVLVLAPALVLAAPDRRRAGIVLAVLAGTLALAGALAAVKLWPMASFLGRVERYPVEDPSSIPPWLLVQALLSRDPSLTAHQTTAMAWFWWEYGAYVGLVPLALALLGAVACGRKAWGWVLLAGVFLLLAWGNRGPCWPLLRRLPGFTGLRVPSRMMLHVVLALAVLAALGVTQVLAWAGRVRRVRPWMLRVAAGVLLAGVLADLAHVSRPVLAEAFPLPPVAGAHDAAPVPPFRQVRSRLDLRLRVRASDMYDHAVRNEGALRCYERLHLPVRAHPVRLRDGSANPAYPGEVRGTAGEVTLTEFSPNRFVVAGQRVPAGAVLLVNQNHDPDWTAGEEGVGPLVVERCGGLLCTRWRRGGERARIIWRYQPPEGPLGASVTAVALLLVAVAWRRARRARRG